MSEPIGSVSVDVTANLDKLGPGFAQAKAQTSAFEKQAADSMARVSAATEGLTANQKKLVEQMLASKVSAAEAALVFGKTADAQKLLAAFTAATTVETKAQTAAFRLNSTAIREIIVLAREFGRGNLSRVPGSASILFQQLQAGEGGLAGAFKALGALFTPTVIGIGAISAATLAAVKVTHDYNVELEKFRGLSQGAGAGAGLTAIQLQNEASRGASQSGTTVGQARDLENALLRTGQVSGQVFAGILADEKKFAGGSGENLKQAQSELVKMFEDPSKGAEELEARFGKLSASEINNIKVLQAQGDMAGAQVALQQALAKSVGDLNGHLAGAKGAWSSFAAGASQAADAAGKVLSILNALALGVDLSKVDKALQQQAVAAKAAALAVQNSKASVAGAQVAQSLDPDFAPKATLKAQQDILLRGAMGAGAQGDTAAFDAQTAALAKVNRARESYLSDAEKDHKLALLNAQAEGIRAKKETEATRAQLGAIAAEKTRVELSGKVMSASEVEQRAADAANVASAKQSRSANNHAEALAREAAAMVENAKGSLALADAYLKGDAAALKAEATRKASTDATKKGIALEAQIRRQVDVDVADRIAAGAKEVSTLTATARAQRVANEAVRSGAQTVEQANTALEMSQQLRDVSIAAEAAHAVVVQQGTKATEEEIAADAAAARVLLAKKTALEAVNKAQFDAQRLATIEATTRRNEEIELEIKLLGKSNDELDRQLAILRATRTLNDQNETDPAKRATFIASAVSGASASTALESGKFLQGQRDAVRQQIESLRILANVYGMTTQQAEAYRFEQQAVLDATLRGITLDDAQRTALHALAQSYGSAAAAATELERRQRGAADAAAELADQFGNTITDILDGTSKSKDALRSLAKDLERSVLQAGLTGKGPFAGLLGTDKTAGPGQPNGGLLSGFFGKLLGVGKGAAPAGTSTDPLFVTQVGGLGGLGDLLGGKSANENDLLGAAGGDNFLDRLGDVFKENSSGGFVGALKGIFGGGGGGGGGFFSKLFGGGGGGGGIGSFFSDNQGGIGSVLGSLLATVAHDGMPAGAQGTGRTRAVDPRIFLSAPRLHSGLAPGEFPAILEHGEGVISKRNAANANHRASTIIVNVSGVDDLAGFRRNDRQIARKLKQQYGIG